MGIVDLWYSIFSVLCIAIINVYVVIQRVIEFEYGIVYD